MYFWINKTTVIKWSPDLSLTVAAVVRISLKCSNSIGEPRSERTLSLQNVGQKFEIKLTLTTVKIFLNWPCPASFLYFRLFYEQLTVNMFNKSCRWLDSNRVPVVSEAKRCQLCHNQCPTFKYSGPISVRKVAYNTGSSMFSFLGHPRHQTLLNIFGSQMQHQI